MAEHPELNDVQSLLLLGCYTGVTNEVKNWRAIYPKLKIIGGYDGSAPNSTRPQGHDYISDILLNEKKLVKLNSAQTIDPDVKKMLTGIEHLNAAVWIDPLCSDEGKGFYYASKVDRNFVSLDPSACEKAMAEISALSPDFEKYNSGELEPPKETGAGTPLRNIYDKTRTHEHCLKANQSMMGGYYGLNANASFNLLFWHGVKQNFAEFYDKDMQEAQKILDTIKVEDIIKGTEDNIAALNGQLEDQEKTLAEFKADPEKFKQKLEAQSKDAEKKKTEFEQKPAYQALMQRLRQSMNFQMSPEETKLLNEANTLMMKASGLQFELQRIQDGSFERDKKFGMQMTKQFIDQKQSSIATIKNNPDALKKVFAPTKSIIKDKTRKELLENVHNAYKLSALDGVTPKQRAALGFISSTSEQHLRYFKNPFSWHEYTGNRPENIPDAPKLSQYIKMHEGGGYGNIGYGSYGGYGGYGGGGFGTGFTGGSMGGANGGAGPATPNGAYGGAVGF